MWSSTLKGGPLNRSVSLREHLCVWLSLMAFEEGPEHWHLLHAAFNCRQDHWIVIEEVDI